MVVSAGEEEDGWDIRGGSLSCKMKHSRGTLHDLLHLGLQLGMVSGGNGSGLSAHTANCILTFFLLR